MERKLLFTNSKLINMETANIKADVSELTYLNEFFKEHELGPLTHQKLHEILTDHNKVISNIVKDRIPIFNDHVKLRNNKEKILSQMELPQIDLYKISHLKLFVNKGFDSFYDFGDKVTLNEDRLRIYLDKHRYYTDNVEVLKAYDELNVIADLLSNLNEKLNLMPSPQALHPDHLDSDYVKDFFEKLSGIYSISSEGFRIRSDGFQKATRILLKKAME